MPWQITATGCGQDVLMLKVKDVLRTGRPFLFVLSKKVSNFAKN
jgi:hypothetical protein